MSGRVSTVTDADRWDLALRLFGDWLAGHDYSESTAARLTKQMRRFGRDMAGTSPWDVTHQQIETWLDGLSCGQSGLYQYRTSLRTFYHWAYRAGRVGINPSAHVSGYRRKYAPESWRRSIAEWRRWLEAGHLSPATVGHEIHLVTQLANETAVVSPWDMTTADLTEWMAGHRWHLEGARSARAAVRSFYRWAVTSGYLADSPADGLPKVKASTPCPRAVPEQAYESALRLANGEDLLMLRLAGDLGLRVSEIAAVHTRDLVDEGAGWVLYVRGKGDKTRRIPVPESLARQIRERGAGWVFPSPRIGGDHRSAVSVGAHVKRFLPTGYSTHKLRHRFATQIYGVSHDLFVTQQLLGHASPNTTQRYVQLPDAAARSLVEAVAR